MYNELKKGKIKMTTYTKDVLKTLLQAGLTEKPENCDQETWEQAKAEMAAPVAEPAYEPYTAPQNQTVVPLAQSTQPAAQSHAEAFQVKDSYSFDDFKSTGMAVDAILSIRSGIPTVSKKEIVKKAFKAKLLFAETKVKQTIKCETPDKQVHYFSTYGGGVDSRDGRPFSEKIAFCQMHDHNAFVYPSADLVFVLEEDLVDPDGKVVAQKGAKVGHSTSATSRKPLEEFYAACNMKGINTKTDEVPVVVGFKTMTNKEGSRSWCIVTVDLAK